MRSFAAIALIFLVLPCCGPEKEAIRDEKLPKLQNKILAPSDPLLCAELLAGELKDPEEKIRALRELSRARQSLAQIEQAQAMLFEALSSVALLSPGSEQISWRLRLAIDFASLGLKEEALKTVSQALEDAKALPPGAAGQNSALLKAALAFYELGAEDKVLQVFQAAMPPSKQEKIIASAARQLLKRNLFHQAISAAHALNSPADRVQLLTSLAESTSAKKLIQPANLFLSAALKSLPEVEDSFAKAGLTLEIARIYRSIGESQKGLKHLQDAAALLKTAGAGQVKLIARLAHEQAAVEQGASASLTLERTLNILPKLPRNEESELILFELALAHAKLRRLQSARRLVLGLKDPFLKTIGLLELAAYYSGQERRQEALDLLEPAKSAALTASLKEDRIELLAKLSGAYLKAGKYEEMRALGSKLQELEKPSVWSKRMRAQGLQLIEQGRTREALKMAHNLENPYLEAVIMIDVARKAFAGKEPQAALHLINQALQVTEKIDNPRRNLALIEYCLHFLLEFGELEEAQSLIKRLPASNAFFWLLLTAEAHAAGGTPLLAQEVWQQAIQRLSLSSSVPQRISALASLGQTGFKLGLAAKLPPAYCEAG